MAGKRASNAASSYNEQQGRCPQHSSPASAGSPSFASGCPLALLGHRHTILSRCVLENEERRPSRVASLSAPISPLLWHDRCGRIQAAIGEAAGDLRNLPGSILHVECELKRALIVVGIPIGSDTLEQQIPDRRGIARLIDPTVDNRDANQERWGRCSLFLQGLRVLPPGRIQILLVDGIAERGEYLRGPGGEPGKRRRRWRWGGQGGRRRNRRWRWRGSTVRRSRCRRRRRPGRHDGGSGIRSMEQ